MEEMNIRNRAEAKKIQGNLTIADARYEFLRQSEEGRIPHMKISLLNEEGKTIRKGYLTPFRGYRFQVSGDAEGNGDCGSTFVMDLKDLIMRSVKPYQASDLIEMMANQAIFLFVKNTLNICEGKVNAKCIDFFSASNSDTLGKFIEESMKWILKTDDLAEYGVVVNHIWSEEGVAYCDE